MSYPPSYCDVKESQHRTGAPLNSKVTLEIAEPVFQDKRSPQRASISIRPFLVVWGAKLGIPFSGSSKGGPSCNSTQSHAR